MPLVANWWRFEKKRTPNWGPANRKIDGRASGLRANVHEFAQTASILKRHHSGHFGEQRIIAADSHIESRLELGSPLPDYDSSAINELSGKTLYSQSLRLAVSSIPGASHSLFVCHTDPLNLLH
jgi:hypothetical protein